MNALLVSLLLVQQAQPPASDKLSIEDVFSVTARCLRPVLPHQPLGWMPDGKGWLVHDDGFQIIDAATGTKAPLYDATRMEQALARIPGISGEQAREWARQKGLGLSEDKTVALFNAANDLFALRLADGTAARLTNDPGEEVGETLSPDGRLCAYISDWNIHVVPTAGGTPRALTSGGHENLLMGRLDWVYQEEVYGRGNFGAFWWSPDSTRIAFLRLDESPVGDFVVVDHGPLMQNLEHWRYPKAGQPNPKVALGVVDVAGGAPRWMDLTPYLSDEFLIVRVGWSPDGKEVVFQVQDRIQTWLDVCSADPATGKVKKLFRETTDAWVEPTDTPTWTKDGARFLWLSERDGHSHLYLYARDGKLIRRLTEGAWDVAAITALDEPGNRVWFTGSREDVKDRQLYVVSLDGGEIKAVTQGAGTHTASMAPTCDRFLDMFTSITYPGRIDLFAASGQRQRVIAESDIAQLERFKLPPPEFVQVKTKDGFAMEAYMIKPAGFGDAAGSGVARKAWPVVCHIYGGPHSPKVQNKWLGKDLLWHHSLAQQGYLVWICDNRSASGKGLAATKACYKRFGPTELSDLLEGLDWLVAQGRADNDRVALWGWSFGGYMTAYAMTHSTRFKCGISGAPVTDWSLYDSIYTERYMDTPQRNPEGYAKGSVTKAAANLSGRMLLVHGVIDENVHVQNSLQFAEALQHAGKQFELMLYPKNRHPVIVPPQARHLYQMMTDFLVRNL